MGRTNPEEAVTGRLLEGEAWMLGRVGSDLGLERPPSLGFRAGACRGGVVLNPVGAPCRDLGVCVVY